MKQIDVSSGHVFEAIYAHAGAVQPRECCGLLYRPSGTRKLTYMPAANVWPEAEGDRFSVDPADYAHAEDQGEIVAIVHSHPNASANPSMADRVGCERSGLPWIIVGWPSGMVKQLEPEGWQAPYKGREFTHGVLDCYTLIQDWYRRELAVELPDVERRDDWWQDRPGRPHDDLYMQHFAAAGFVAMQGEPQRHDLIVMQVKADVANHGAIYLGDGVMLHHLHGQLSTETVYGGYWLRHTVALLRHREVIDRQAALQQAA